MKVVLLAILAVVITYTVLQFKSEEQILSAIYQMEACEKCFHMTVVKSQNVNLIGETIIPVSKTVNIEHMIERVALSRSPLCLKGKLYRFTINWLKLSSSGKRFEVVNLESDAVCENLAVP